MATGIIEVGTLKASISDSNQLAGQIEQNQTLHGQIGSIERGTLTAVVSNSNRLTGQIEQGQALQGKLGLPDIIYTSEYKAGMGIVIENRIISLDNLIIDCGVGTT